jgi:peptidyl-prolyl cis-trans isomerase SurA
MPCHQKGAIAVASRTLLSFGTLLLGLGLGFGALADGDLEELVDGIAAQVGEDVVLVSEVFKLTASAERRMEAAGAPPAEIAKLHADGLEKMIEERLVEQQIRRLELFASETEINNAVELIARENGLSVEQLVDTVRAQGLDFEDYKAQLKTKVEQQKVMTVALAPKIVIEEDEVRDLYDQRFRDQPDGGEQVHVRQLLVPASQEQDLESACAAVEGAAARIAAGEAFEVVAQEVSVVSPRQGGDIGWLHTDSLATWMAKLIAALDPGQVSPVNRQPFGCNILKLVERREFEPVSYELAQAQLYEEIYQPKLQAELQIWMNELRDNTYIRRGGYFAAAAEFDAISVKAESELEKEALLR